ncbi:MAG: N,N-dimethylformamidase beta subunit family domain-containing protein, partial [Polyangiales bacterium]
MHRTAIAALTFVTLCISTRPAFAGFITDENAKAGVDYDWVPRNDGTSFADGVADMYPASYSIARGEPVRLKVRSTTGYTLHVYRVGWYGGAGAREVATRTGLPADPQPYPVAEPEFGIVRAGWHDSVTIPTDESWTPGIYVA